MSRINNGLISTYVRQLYLLNEHQDLAENNLDNQALHMAKTLAMLAEAIGNANAVCIASIDEDAINVLIERTRLQANQSNKDNSAPFTEVQ